MAIFKKSLRFIPEVYFLLSALYYWTLAGQTINYIAIALVVLMLYQAWSQNKATGLLLGGVLLAINAFLVLALISELREYPTFDADARNLLLFGSLYLGSNLAMAGWMFGKHLVSVFSDETGATPSVV